MNNEELVEIGKQTFAKKRGSKSASIEATTTAKKEEISQVIKESFQYFKRPIVQSDGKCLRQSLILQFPISVSAISLR